MASMDIHSDLKILKEKLAKHIQITSNGPTGFYSQHLLIQKIQEKNIDPEEARSSMEAILKSVDEAVDAFSLKQTKGATKKLKGALDKLLLGHPRILKPDSTTAAVATRLLNVATKLLNRPAAAKSHIAMKKAPTSAPEPAALTTLAPPVTVTPAAAVPLEIIGSMTGQPIHGSKTKFIAVKRESVPVSSVSAAPVTFSAAADFLPRAGEVGMSFESNSTAPANGDKRQERHRKNRAKGNPYDTNS